LPLHAPYPKAWLKGIRVNGVAPGLWTLLILDLPRDQVESFKQAQWDEPVSLKNRAQLRILASDDALCLVRFYTQIAVVNG